MKNFSRSRLGFVFWGLRVYNSIFFLGYPILGALFAIPDFSPKSLGKIFLFGVCNVLFLMQVFLFNDWGDAHLNPEEPFFRGTQALKHPEIISARGVLILCLALALISLSGIFYLCFQSGVMITLVGLINIFYSHPRFSLKKHFILPELAHISFGFIYFLSGWRLFEPLNSSAVLLAVFFGIILMAGNFANQIEHFDEELKTGLRTFAIIFGKRPAYRLSLWLFFLSALYLLLLSLFGPTQGWLVYPAGFLIVLWSLSLLYFRGKNLIQNISKLRRAIRIIYALFSIAVMLGILLTKNLK